jgi:hypothetical protein
MVWIDLVGGLGMPTLREILYNRRSFSFNKDHAGTAEFRDRLNEVLKAAGCSEIGNDTSFKIRIIDDLVVIDFKKYYRSIEISRQEFTFPEFILDADDPVCEAMLWKLEQKVKAARSAYTAASRHLSSCEEDLVKAEKELSAFVENARPTFNL